MIKQVINTKTKIKHYVYSDKILCNGYTIGKGYILAGKQQVRLCSLCEKHTKAVKKYEKIERRI